MSILPSGKRNRQPQSGAIPISSMWAALGLNSLFMPMGAAGRDATGRYLAALTGTLPPVSAGKAGMAFAFAAAQSIYTPTGSLSAGTSFSKFAVITLNNVSHVGTISCTSGSSGVQLRVNNANLELLHSATAVVLSVAHDLSANQLACVGVTCDGTTARLFVNGREIGSAACAINFLANIGQLTIGARDGSGTESLDGKMFAHADFSRAVSQAAARSVTNNLWQVFAAPARNLWLSEASGPATPAGTFAASLANAVMAAAGSVVNPGSFASTLGGATMSASGSASVSPSGTFAATLSGATMASSGATTSAGTFAATLAGVSMAAVGVLDNRGALAATLDGAGMSASGTVAPNATGTLSTTLDGATMTAYGYNGVPPVLAGFFHRLPKNPRHVQRLP